MANGTLGFFEPSSAITVPACWTFQDGGAITSNKTRVNELGATGNEIKKALHDAKSTTSFVYIANTTAGALTFPKAGSVSNGWHIDSISVTWDRASCAPKMTVSCHKHDSTKNHTTCRMYAATISVNAQEFGCPSNFGDAFSLAQSAVVDLRDVTYTLSCTHTDELGRTGEFLAGDNYDGVETLAVNLTGKAESDDYTTTWDLTSGSKNPTNTGATTSSITLEHHVANED